MNHTPSVSVRNIVLGEGIPKICIPLVSTCLDALLNDMKKALDHSADLIEWRVDWMDDILKKGYLEEILPAVRKAAGDTPLLFTFRTAKEGGEKAISNEAYQNLNLAVAKSGFVDLIDVEAFRGDEIVTNIISIAHDFNVKVVSSNHDFDKTPEKEELIRRLCKMQELDADIPKIAVMPTCRRDVLMLLDATLEMTESYADRPIITMSMAGTGVISRLAGEAFGSALTFGAATKASAPGQIPVNELKQVLDILHKSL